MAFSKILFQHVIFSILVIFFFSSNVDGSKDIRARYPIEFYQPDVIDNLGVEIISAKTLPPFAHKTQDYQFREGNVRRRPQSSRYQNIFSNSRVIHGSEFAPKELSPYVGRMYDRRRETFRWNPPSNILDSTLVNY
uniref:Uncharacterized protein n=1 Tax=Panagrolaimus sp. PS1159 TaxID=55785 RepID=A0AC35EWX3_9BILA